MKYKGLTIRLMLALVLVLTLAFAGTAMAEDPGPNDPPTSEPPPPEEPALPYGNGEGAPAVDVPPALALESVGSVTNGDFETGNLSGWGRYHAGSTAGWSAYSGTHSPLSGHSINAPPQGTYAATSDQTGPNVQILYQYITLPAAPEYDLSFVLYYHNWAGAFHTPATLNHTVFPNQQYRVDIMKPTSSLTSVAAGDILANVFQSKVGDSAVLGPTPVTFDLSPFAGQTVRLRFAEVDNQGYFNASVDNVHLVQSVPPGVEPKTVSGNLLLPGESIITNKTVTTPPIPPMPDIYFLADTTGSMYGAIANVRANAATILAQVAAQQPDAQFGAGNYKDFPYDFYAFQNNSSIDGQAAALAAINSWYASGGADGPEAQLFALDRIADGAPTWRSGSTKIVVWFGDWPGHDPVCQAISGLGYDITEASVTSKLVAADVRVIAISVTSGTGLDLDPQPYSYDYNSYCGTPGGTAGQATRIAAATGGVHLQNVTPGEVSAKILEGLQNLPATVTPQLDLACSTELDYAFSPTSQTVTSGDAASFVETVTVKSDATGGLKTCTVDWLINGVSAGSDFEQSISIYVDTPPEITSITATPSVIAVDTSVDLVAEFTDADYDVGDTHTCTINWDDGTTEPGVITEPSATGLGTCTGSHSYSAAEIYNVVVTVTDSRDVSDSDSVMVVVYDPSAGFVTGGGWIDSPAGAYKPAPLPFFGGHYYEIVSDSVNWATANEAANASSLEGCASAHLATITSQEEQDAIYEALGNEIAFVWLGARQEGGEWQWVTGEPWEYTNWQPGEPSGESDATALHVGGGGVPSPDGWVYDGKWNDTNPDWSYPYMVEYDECLSGKANFGFVSKYKKGADTPTGNTEFQFHAADLNFHSDSYDWLVVTGSNYARFKGVGTINGMYDSNGLPYKFMLWAGDGTGTDGADTFRIKIWEEDEFGVETVIYDNGMDQDIASGSIVVHTK